MQWYKSKTDGTLYGKQCLKHKVTKELCIFGLRGEIYRNNDLTFKVTVYRNRTKTINKLGKFLNIETSMYSVDDEAVFTVPIAHLKYMMTQLKVPRDIGCQLQYSEIASTES